MDESVELAAEPEPEADAESEQIVVFLNEDPENWVYLPELRRMWQDGQVTGRTKVWMDTEDFGEKWKKLKVRQFANLERRTDLGRTDLGCFLSAFAHFLVLRWCVISAFFVCLR